MDRDTPCTGIDTTEVHIWLARPEAFTDAEVVARFDALMTADERERMARFRFERHRHLFLVTRGLVRTTLSRYADIAPAAWRFCAEPDGRPEIASPTLAERLRFNLSHTDGMVACAVTLELDVGCDVENADRNTPIGQLADRYFSADEAAVLHACAEDAYAERFYRYWTLKESYLKARGMGLRIPLGSFSLSFPDAVGELRATIRFHEQESHAGYDDPDAWQLGSTRVSERHLLSWAVHRPQRPDLTITLRDFEP